MHDIPTCPPDNMSLYLYQRIICCKTRPSSVEDLKGISEQSKLYATSK